MFRALRKEEKAENEKKRVKKEIGSDDMDGKWEGIRANKHLHGLSWHHFGK